MMGWFERLLCKIFRYRNIRRGDVLLFRRFYLTPRSWSCVLLLHHYVSKDLDQHPHDHPWAFITWILAGGYVEETQTYEHDGVWVETKTRWPGALLYRAAKHTHRLTELLDPVAGSWSLVLSFGRHRDWGFHTPDGWVDWRTYNGLPPDYVAPLEDRSAA